MNEVNGYTSETVDYTYDKRGNILSKTITKDGETNTINYTYGDSNWKDKLTAYDGKTITYDEIGNPLTYDGWTFNWQKGRQLASISNSDTTLSFKYNDSGIRTSKTVDGVETKYLLDGSTIVAQKTGDTILWFYYDGAGQLTAMQNGSNGEYYYYVYNYQGDVVALLDSSLNYVANYTYDSWGKLVSVTGSNTAIGNLNPFRYRGYYYDTETGLYYVNSRYYNSEIGRFINADSESILGVQTNLYDKNLFAYCDNNPVIRLDVSGNVWETVFDVVSLGASVVEVAINPADPWAWAGLVGDAIDLVPFVTGVGEITRGIKVSKKIVDGTDNVIDAAKATRKTVKNTTGSYEIMYKSGKNYIGKGSFNRAIVSASQHAKPNKLNNFLGDEVVSIMWKSAPSYKQAFIDEYLMQKRFGGVLSCNKDLRTYNQIWSPGRRYI